MIDNIDYISNLTIGSIYRNPYSQKHQAVGNGQTDELSINHIALAANASRVLFTRPTSLGRLLFDQSNVLFKNEEVDPNWLLDFQTLQS